MRSNIANELRPVSHLEFGLFVVSILAIGGAWAALVPNGQTIGAPQTEVATIAASGDIGKQAVLTLIYLINLAALIRFREPGTWRLLGLPLTTLLAWCLMSSAWSVMPDATVRRVIAMAGTVIVGVYAGQRLNEDRLSAVLCVAAAFAVIGSLLWGAVSPAHGFDTDGDLRGLFYHKNAFGLFLAISLLAIFYRVVVLRHRDARYAILFGLCGCAFLLAHSATPIVGMTVALVTLFVANWARGSGGLLQIALPGVIAVTVALGILFSADLSAVAAEVLGRDPSLSGRTSIWAFVIPMIHAQPWVGYGYGIFWLGEDAPGALFWYWSKQFELHAHDGYLQLLLDTGIVGLLLFLSALGLLIIRAIRLSSKSTWTLSLWVSLFLGFFLVCNITDTELWIPNSLMATLFVWAVARTNKATFTDITNRLYPTGKYVQASENT